MNKHLLRALICSTVGLIFGYLVFVFGYNEIYRGIGGLMALLNAVMIGFILVKSINNKKVL